VGDSQQPGPVGEQPVEGGQVKLSDIVDRNRADHGAGLARDQMPWDDVGMMLQARKEDLVSRSQ
jgi:hypothetical protein